MDKLLSGLCHSVWHKCKLDHSITQAKGAYYMPKINHLWDLTVSLGYWLVHWGVKLSYVKVLCKDKGEIYGNVL